MDDVSFLSAVMEVMYHCSLRAGPLKEEWWNENPELYSFLKTSSNPIYDLSGNNSFVNTITAQKLATANETGYFFTWKMEPSQDNYSPGLRPLDEWLSYHEIVPIKFDLTDNQPIRSQDFVKMDEFLTRMRRKYQARQMIMFCEYNNGESCEDMFHPVLTDKGICYAFNSDKLSSYMLQSNYTKMFSKVFQGNRPRIPLDSENLTSTFAMTIILDSHKSGNLVE